MRDRDTVADHSYSLRLLEKFLSSISECVDVCVFYLKVVFRSVTAMMKYFFKIVIDFSSAQEKD